MQNVKFFATVLALSITLITGCENETVIDNNALSRASARQAAASTQDMEAKLAKVRSLLPADFEKRRQQNEARFFKTHPEYREMIERVIEPTACDDNTAISQWLGDQFVDWNGTIFNLAAETAMFDIPTYDALFFGGNADNQSYGVNGDFSQRITKTFKDLKRFWNIPSDNIELAPMHGSMLRDRQRVIRAYTVLYGLDPQLAATLADIVVDLLDTVPQYRDGNHPYFTFNAFALESLTIPGFGTIPDKIIMGDGIMEAYAAIGYGDIAPQAILAHEFGHHIQFELNLFDDVQSPEGTRRTELMADSYSAYYLSHSRGASMQWKRVQRFLQVFFNIGDCSFDSNGHHGTPTQRMAAAGWAYSVADGAQKQGHILTSQNFTALFEEQLPKLVTQ